MYQNACIKLAVVSNWRLLLSKANTIYCFTVNIIKFKSTKNKTKQKLKKRSRNKVKLVWYIIIYYLIKYLH